VDDHLGVLWGKSDAAGSMHLVIAHLLDTAAIGELIWDQYLSPGVRRELDRCSGQSGRTLLSLVCGLHDVGKATPAFQSKDAALAAVVRASGLDWPASMNARAWHHTLAGARVVGDVFESAGWTPRARRWTWPLIAGHHGRVPGPEKLDPPDRHVHGRGQWAAAQRALVERVVNELGVDLRGLADIEAPSRALQLAVSGLVIMADWIASDEHHFDGISSLGDVSMCLARKRAAKSWAALGLRGGWRTSALCPPGGGDLVRQRFGQPEQIPESSSGSPQYLVHHRHAVHAFR